MKMKGAVFDMDGTLLDSMGIWDSLGERYLDSLGIQPHENLKETLRTMSLQQSAHYLQKEYGLKKTTEEIMRELNRLLEDFYRFEAPLKPGVQKLLAWLKANSVKLCLATATDRFLTEAALKRCGILPYFEEIFTCEEVGAGKDEPRIFETALDFLKTEKAETVVFEDALYAIETAKKAGFPVAAVYDRYEKDQKKVRELADVYLMDPGEIEKLESDLPDEPDHESRQH